MRRIIVLMAGIAVLAVPLAGRAAPAPGLTLLSPTSGSAVSGAVSVQWSYTGFHRSTPVDVEVRRGSDPFVRVARVTIDDGTPGYVGSARWTTSSADDGTDWEVRVVPTTNKFVSSSASGIVVDNTGPTTTIDDATGVSVLLDVAGSAVDAVSAVAAVGVAFVGADGVETMRAATCTCGTEAAAWSVSTAGLTTGTYSVRAWALDEHGNLGPDDTATLVIVTVPEATVTQPEPTVPDVTSPEVTVPSDVPGQPDLGPSPDPGPVPDPLSLVPPLDGVSGL